MHNSLLMNRRCLHCGREKVIAEALRSCKALHDTIVHRHRAIKRSLACFMAVLMPNLHIFMHTNA